MALLRWDLTKTKRAVRESVGGPSTFEDLALPLLPALYNVASWLSRNATDAEDLVQETFLKALRGFDSFEPGSNFKAWIFRILRNTYLTSRSGLQAQRTVSLDEQLEEQRDFGPAIYPEAAIDRSTPEINLILSADRAALHDAMEKLPATVARSHPHVRRGRDEVQGDRLGSRSSHRNRDVSHRARSCRSA